MQGVIGYKKIVSCILIVTMFGLCMPKSPLKAAMITTESVINLSEDVLSDRERVRAFLDREEVRSKMESYGLSPVEAIARVDTLTDREIALIVGKLDQLPAGGYYSIHSLASALFVYGVFLVIWGIYLGIKWLTENDSEETIY